MRNGEEMMLPMAHGSDTQHEMMQNRLTVGGYSGSTVWSDSRPDDELSDGTSSPNATKIYGTTCPEICPPVGLRLHGSGSGIREG